MHDPVVSIVCYIEKNAPRFSVVPCGVVLTRICHAWLYVRAFYVVMFAREKEVGHGWPIPLLELFVYGAQPLEFPETPYESEAHVHASSSAVSCLSSGKSKGAHSIVMNRLICSKS
jgi:hypothetical protein